MRKRLVVEVKGEIIVESERTQGARVVSIMLDEPIVLGLTARVEGERNGDSYMRVELRVEAARATFSPFVAVPTTQPTLSIPDLVKPPRTETKATRATAQTTPKARASNPPVDSDDAWPFEQGKTVVDDRKGDDITTEREE
jgi:hypothetical protein